MMIRFRTSKPHFCSTMYLPWPFSRRKFISLPPAPPEISAPTPPRKRNLNLGRLQNPEGLNRNPPSLDHKPCPLKVTPGSDIHPQPSSVSAGEATQNTTDSGKTSSWSPWLVVARCSLQHHCTAIRPPLKQLHHSTLLLRSSPAPLLKPWKLVQTVPAKVTLDPACI